MIFPAIYVNYAKEGTFASCFKLREVFNIIGKNAGAFFTAWGMSLVAGLVVGVIASDCYGGSGLDPLCRLDHLDCDHPRSRCLPDR